MRWPKLLRRKKPIYVKGRATPLHGITCRCSLCGFTSLMAVLPVDRPFTRHVSRSQMARARLAVSAPE